MNNRLAFSSADIVVPVNMRHKQAAYHKGQTGNGSCTGQLQNLGVMNGKKTEADGQQAEIQQHFQQHDNGFSTFKK